MPKKILIVEDEQDIAMVLSKRLSDAGYEVLFAADAVLAVKHAIQNKPDLVILDLMLPAGGGLSVLKTLKTSTKTCLIPVLVLTGSKNEQLKQTVQDIGIQAYFEKPYDFPELLKWVELLIKEERPS